MPSNEFDDYLQDHGNRTSEEDSSGFDRNDSNDVCNGRGLKIHENHWPIKNAESIKRNSSDEENKQKIQIKVFNREKHKGIICLDCGKCFKQKNTYNYHKRW